MRRYLWSAILLRAACDDRIPGLCKVDRDCTEILPNGFCLEGVCVFPEDGGSRDGGEDSGDDGGVFDAGGNGGEDAGADAAIDGGGPSITGDAGSDAGASDAGSGRWW